jgi:hypothetical protein
MGVGARARLVVYDREAGAEFLVLVLVLWTLVWGTFMLAGWVRRDRSHATFSCLPVCYDRRNRLLMVSLLSSHQQIKKEIVSAYNRSQLP